MERSLLDTDTFSEMLRGRNAQVERSSNAYLSVFGFFTLSVTTVTELIDGFRRIRRDDQVDLLLRRISTEGHEIVPIDLDTAALAGRIFGDLHRTGQPIGRSDPFIAAIAVHQDLPLVTGNTKHFERIQSLGYPLRLENWRGE
jgi:tRNA(fMet)-specific endonuclease VapC